MMESETKGDFPRGPVVKTPYFQGRGHGFEPWLGSQNPTHCGEWPPK